jgi:hypothetical protein
MCKAVFFNLIWPHYVRTVTDTLKMWKISDIWERRYQISHIHEEIKRRLLNSKNAWYCSVQNRLSSHLLSKSVKIKIHKTVTLAVVLYRCENLSLTLMEERLRVFENRVVRTILGSKSDEITRGWRKLHNEELHILYSSPNMRKIKLRRMTWARHLQRTNKFVLVQYNLSRRMSMWYVCQSGRAPAYLWINYTHNGSDEEVAVRSRLQ